MNKQPKKYNSTVLSEILNNRNPLTYEGTKRNMLLAARIDDALITKGWTKKYLADTMQKSPSEVTKWLSGTHNFTLETLYLIESYLGVTLFEVPAQRLEYA